MNTALEALLPPLVPIPATSFVMGTPDSERSTLARCYGGTRESYAEESPQHTLAVAAFQIAQVPITNALYAVFQTATGAHRPITWGGAAPPAQLGDHPVTDLSWLDALALCRWLSRMTGRRYRLPTEAEWECAARGTDGRTFPWGEQFDPLHCNVRESGLHTTTPVGAYPAGSSPYGVLDLSGNVWEWTQSLQATYPYRADDGRNAARSTAPRSTSGWIERLRQVMSATATHSAPAHESRRIMRGGCYANPQGFARCACRLRLAPARRSPFTGVRVASDA